MTDQRSLPLRTLAAAYDRSAEGYDDRFRDLQREKYRAGLSLLLPWLAEPGAPLAPGAAGGPPWLPRLLDAGAGTGLFAEWLRDPAEPHAKARAALRGPLDSGRCVALDASLGMVRQSRARACAPLVADLAAPPLREGRFALVVAFTAVLDRVPQALGALGALVQPGGALLVTFLVRESPTQEQVAGACGLSYRGHARAGQDRLHLLVRA
jgi:SAM-dependent methyltransferase